MLPGSNPYSETIRHIRHTLTTVTNENLPPRSPPRTPTDTASTPDPPLRPNERGGSWGEGASTNRRRGPIRLLVASRCQGAWEDLWTTAWTDFEDFHLLTAPSWLPESDCSILPKPSLWVKRKLVLHFTNQAFKYYLFGRKFSPQEVEKKYIVQNCRVITDGSIITFSAITANRAQVQKVKKPANIIKQVRVNQKNGVRNIGKLDHIITTREM